VRDCRIVFLIAMSLASFDIANAECNLKEDWLWDYVGDIDGKYQIQATLTREGESIKGVYFYHKYLKDIELSGNMQSANDIHLSELDGSGNESAVFSGEFVTQDPRGKFKSTNLKCEVLIGTWESSKSDIKFPFYLSMSGGVHGKISNRYAVAGATSNDLVHKNAYAFWIAVKENNKEEVAKYISYPIQVNFNKKDHYIKNAIEFVTNYDSIMPKWKRDAIIKSIPHNMFAKYTGIMLGRGVVWFGPDGKVINI